MKSIVDKIDLLMGLVKKMRELSYAEDYIGEQVAIIIWVLDNYGEEKK